MAVPATIRTNNPGAMWPGPSSKKFGSTKFETLRDSNKIAIFGDPVNGAAAQFDLLNRSYTGLTLAAAMKKWTGNNSPEAELRLALKEIDATPDTVLTRDFLQNPLTAISFAKGMAENETGKPFPLSDDEWMKAHTLAFPAAPKNGAGNWMDLARADLGISEIAGKKDNPLIMQWYVDVGHPEVEHDETPNCAAFVGSKLKRAGMAYLETLLARDYLKCGTPVDDPKPGDLVIFWRNSPSSWEGHVAFVDSVTAKTVRALGANQGNKVSVANFQRSQVLGFRRPVPAQKPTLVAVKDSPSLRMQLLGAGGIVVGYFMDGLHYVVDGVQTVFGLVPGVSSDLDAFMTPAERTAQTLNIPWAQISLAVAAVCIVASVIRQLPRKRSES